MEVVDLLTRRFLERHPAEAARVLESYEPDTLAAFVRELPPAAAAAALEHSLPATTAECLRRVPAEPAARVLREFQLDLRVAVMRLLEPADRENLLKALGSEIAVPLRRLLRFPEGTIGDLMEPFVLTLPDDITAGEGVKRAKRASRGVRYYVYVIDRAHMLAGVVTLHEMMRAKSGDPIASVMNEDVVRLRAGAGRDEMLKNPYWREFSALPVVDDDDVFLGVLQHSALLRVRDEISGAAPQERILDTALALGELYWMGLAGMFGGIAASGESEHDGSGDDER